jgi:hypothetical protein
MGSHKFFYLAESVKEHIGGMKGGWSCSQTVFGSMESTEEVKGHRSSGASVEVKGVSGA